MIKKLGIVAIFLIIFMSSVNAEFYYKPKIESLIANITNSPSYIPLADIQLQDIQRLIVAAQEWLMSANQTINQTIVLADEQVSIFADIMPKDNEVEIRNFNFEDNDRIIKGDNLQVIIKEKGSVQEMIDSAKKGSTIKVPPGTYQEDLVINKTIKLIGKGVILKGTITINADKTQVSYFTITDYNVSDGDPVIWVNADKVKVYKNTFYKNEDAFEIYVTGKQAVVQGNVINASISTDSGMIQVVGGSTGAVIKDNRLLCDETGQWGPMQLILLKKNDNIKVVNNTITHADDKAIFVGGKGAVLEFYNNTFTDGSGVIFLGNEPKTLNSYKDLDLGAEDVEKNNPGSKVVFGIIENS